ncbi:hypothetical protein FOL47_004902, partial [Perkinsus chesapeaki]
VLSTCKRVNISLDIWSRSSRSSYLCAIGHGYTQNGSVNVLLDFARIEGRHTAANIRATLTDILSKCNIGNHDGIGLGAIVSDAAASNKRMVKDLREENGVNEREIPHILCCGHKIHLVVSNSLEIWSRTIDDYPDRTPCEPDSDVAEGDPPDLDDLICEDSDSEVELGDIDETMDYAWSEGVKRGAASRQ